MLEMLAVSVVGDFTLNSIGASQSFWASFIPSAAWAMVRDVGGRSWGKKLVGLDVAAADGSSNVPSKARVLRNLTIAFPFLPIVEFFYVYSSGLRLGDRLAGTSVVDRSPDQQGKGSWSGQLVLTLIGSGVVGWLLW
jgi:uncharacterized RDD family membrane protein YckC